MAEVRPAHWCKKCPSDPENRTRCLGPLNYAAELCHKHLSHAEDTAAPVHTMHVGPALPVAEAVLLECQRCGEPTSELDGVCFRCDQLAAGPKCVYCHEALASGWVDVCERCRLGAANGPANEEALYEMGRQAFMAGEAEDPAFSVEIGVALGGLVKTAPRTQHIVAAFTAGWRDARDTAALATPSAEATRVCEICGAEITFVEWRAGPDDLCLFCRTSADGPSPMTIPGDDALPCDEAPPDDIPGDEDAVGCPHELINSGITDGVRHTWCDSCFAQLSVTGLEVCPKCGEATRDPGEALCTGCDQ